MIHPSKVRALRGKILVRLLDPPGKVGVLFRPEAGSRWFPYGQAVAVGGGKITSKGATQPMDVSVGDVLRLDNFAESADYIDDGEGGRYSWIDIDNVLAIIGPVPAEQLNDMVER